MKYMIDVGTEGGYVMGIESLKYLVIDVDGTMTDGGIYYDENGNELKKFCTRDAAGFFAAHNAGIKIMVLTGRKCVATTRRMAEMKVEYLSQDVKDKAAYLEAFMRDNEIRKEEIGYIGDDLNDLSSMKLVGFVGCPVDSCKEIVGIADYVSSVKGGYGAVRDIIEYILTRRSEWKHIIAEVYGIGV